MLSISNRQGAKGKPSSDFFFIFRMDVGRIANVNSHGYATIGQVFCRHCLGLSNFRPFTLTRYIRSFSKISKGNNVESEIAYSKARAPVLNHGRKQIAVLEGTIRIAFALVPDNSFDGKGNKWCDHPIVKHRGDIWVSNQGRSCFGTSCCFLHMPPASK